MRYVIRVAGSPLWFLRVSDEGYILFTSDRGNAISTEDLDLIAQLADAVRRQESSPPVVIEQLD